MDFKDGFWGWILIIDFEDRCAERGSCGRPPEIAAPAFFTCASSFDELQ